MKNSGKIRDDVESHGRVAEKVPSAVILRGCDFIDFSQKVALKTISLHAKKSRYLNKVTPSERSAESLLPQLKDQERFFAQNRRSE